MSDTVKVIIEIPKEAKQAFDNAESNDLKGGYYDLGGIIGKAIQNGIPLDDVKAEIDKAQEPYKTSTAYDEGVRFGLMLAYQIIDKYKAESEVKPNEMQ